ncbi:MAG TPA: hypothetical protein VI703_03700 [Anaerolineales bacterium]|nr:hypothetical protein [Anaerolineales bacterium]
MVISRTWKIIIGIATFLVAIFPLLVGVLYFAWIFSMVSQFSNFDPNTYNPNTYSPDFDPSTFGYFFLIFPLMMCLGVLQFVMTIFYIIHVINNDLGSRVLRTLSGIGFYFLPWIAMPAYFLIYLAPNKTPDWALEKSLPVPRKGNK